MANELALTEVNFHGDLVQAAQDVDGQVWVPIRRICENLGLDLRPQERKLSGAKWAVRALMALTGSDGKTYEMSCISLKSLPMWLTTLQPSRVKSEIREKLELYQAEAADVLAKHFLGCEVAGPVSLPDTDIREAMQSIASQLGEIVRTEVRSVLAEAVKRPLPEQTYTVKERVKSAGWFTAEDRDRDRVRDLAVRTIVRAGYERPSPEGTSPGSELLFPHRHLAILDDAVFTIWCEVREAQTRRAAKTRQPELFSK